MRRAVLIGALALASCDPVAVQFTPPVCSTTDYPAWQTSAYALPYPPGRSYVVMQGNCGGFSHTPGSSLTFAYDFLMPIGEVVTAARGGRVVVVEESYADGDNERGHENGVLVDHGDGTVGAYVHFTQDGAAVEAGDEVAAGDTLGLSGNTGFSTEPHLHFDVRVGCEAEGAPCETRPVTFHNTAANPRGLVQGGVYTAR